MLRVPVVLHPVYWARDEQLIRLLLRSTAATSFRLPPQFAQQDVAYLTLAHDDAVEEAQLTRCVMSVECAVRGACIWLLR